MEEPKDKDKRTQTADALEAFPAQKRQGGIRALGFTGDKDGSGLEEGYAQAE
jgi:hypothetical protein